MFIHSLYYKDHSTGWTLDHVQFDRLTLLVGASGVGKTQTLKAILNLQKIAKGESLNGVEWDVVFSLADGRKCQWRGAFESKGFSPDLFSHIPREFQPKSNHNQPKIQEETLYLDERIVVLRTGANILYHNKALIKLSPVESIIRLLSYEDYIAPIYEVFERIVDIDEDVKSSSDALLGRGEYLTRLIDETSNVSDLMSINESIYIKFYIAAIKKISMFNDIKRTFIDIFPQVEDLELSELNEYSSFLYGIRVVKIKEKGSPHWIDAFRMSQGMYKTLIYIATIYLCADNSLILIDEFENSLGINCIDEVTSSILSQNRNLQFILTSHHPYIINHISSEHWKILTRKGGVVTAHNAKDVGIGKSKHTAFTQLINLDMYNTGMEDQ